MHHGTSQPSTASRWLASSSRYLSGACCSPRRAVDDAKPQRLMGCLYTHMGLPALFPEPFVHSKIALHGALQCMVRRCVGEEPRPPGSPAFRGRPWRVERGQWAAWGTVVTLG